MKPIIFLFRTSLWLYLIAHAPFATGQKTNNCFQLIFAQLIKSQHTNIDIDDANKINFEEIVDLQLINQNHKDGVLLKRHFKQIDSIDGFGFWEIHSGYYKGQKVFLKTSPLQVGTQRAGLRTREVLNNEVSWVIRLSELEIGPKYHGVAINKNGHYVIITDFLEGYSVNPRTFRAHSQRSLPSDFTPTLQLIHDLEKIKMVMKREQIVMSDLQLRMTGQKALVVDPELLRPAKDPEEVEKVIHEIDVFIQELNKINPAK